MPLAWIGKIYLIDESDHILGRFTVGKTQDGGGQVQRQLAGFLAIILYDHLLLIKTQV